MGGFLCGSRSTKHQLIDIVQRIVDHVGLVGGGGSVHILGRGLAGEDENSGHAVLLADGDVGVEAVAEDAHLIGGKAGGFADHFDSLLIGLAEVGGDLTGGGGHESGDGAGVGNEAGLGGAVEIGVSGEILRAVAYHAAGVVHLLIGESGVKAGNNDISTLLGAGQHGDTVLAEVLNELGSTDEVNILAGAVALEELNGHVARGHDLVGCGREAELCQLLNIEFGGMRGVVGEEQHLLACGAQVVDETDGVGEYLIAEVNGAVHVKDVELLRVKRLLAVFGITEVHNYYRPCFFRETRP